MGGQLLGRGGKGARRARLSLAAAIQQCRQVAAFRFSGLGAGIGLISPSSQSRHQLGLATANQVQIDLGQQLGIQQGPMQVAIGVIDLKSATQGI